MTEPIAVYLEIGAKRTFAGALEWPGWCRRGRTEADALDALLRYATRYARVTALADLPFVSPTDASDCVVTEQLSGNATTDFGAPGVPPAADERPLADGELGRLHSLLQASWQTFDQAVAAAVDRDLRTGPRGGGRDLGKIVAHVSEAEAAYLGKLGSRAPRELGAAREVAVAAITTRAANRPIDDPSRTARRWSSRYFVRRAAWHVLDHAWEIEDRAVP